ncbi:hypothetical protein NQ314_001022 [Rhamnusium bicolor]|uniref:SWIM-type domain-containing protein n=1 Tax=Rhamnusium bicolor TaxID=1586634 RepID=A0AAV8ZUB4_9CUCU|nr:hypothetical protein NQ314_001022 [Rhamnusium bicolor]
MLKTFGKNTVCVDSTHGLNGYDFELTTVMIIDEFGEGFPGAYHAWRANLNKISNSEKRGIVYKILKALVSELCETDFLKELKNFVKFLDEDVETSTFGEYFRSYYVSNVEQWAYCYRKNCGINTNMHIESMHKVVKYIYLDSKKIKRLDKGLHAMSNFIRNKIVDRLIKKYKGSFVVQYHRIDKTWMVDNKKSNYSVSRTDLQRACCPLKCSLCNICVHMYKCTCVDFYVGTTVCKHIHYVHINYQEDYNVTTIENTDITRSTPNLSNNKLEFNEEVKTHLKTLESNYVESQGPQI